MKHIVSDAMIRLAVVLLLVLANGFFVAAEFSLVSIRRSRVEQLVAEGHPLAPAVQRATQRLDSYLAATQLGITMASLGLGWLGEPALAHLIEPALHGLPAAWTRVGASAIAVAIAFAIITALHIILGELAPKSIALQRSEGTALVVSKPLEIFYLVFRPVIQLLNGAGNLLIRFIGLRPATGEEAAHSATELRYLVTASRQAGVLDPVESEMIDRAFQFGETRTYEVMVPRTEIVAVAEDATLDATLDLMANGGHSRLPVYETDLDHVVGIAHLRDLVREVRQGADPTAAVRQFVRQPLVLPETVSIEEALTQMRRTRTQMAILIEEHGGTAGLVTMEDLLEQIVGEVQDEFEPPHESIRTNPDGTVLVDGLLGIDEFDERFNLSLPEQDYDTVGGLVMSELGRVPEAGDEVLLGDYRVRVETMDGRRVATVRVSRR